MAKNYPSRIVCLSAEVVEIIYALGSGNRIVGVTGFAVEPPAARRKPRVSGFSSVNFDKVDALKPELVITFSDVQAEAVKELIRRGHTVLATNQRSLAEIFETILLIGRVIGRETQAQKLADKMRAEIFSRRALRSKRPKVYFEEWSDPFISGIRWVGEMIEAAGGEDIFPELRNVIPAVRNGYVYEIKSAHILQPGPSLLKGFRQLRQIINISCAKAFGM
jgi:iron complex transport system substrate-binding protein